MVTAHRLSASIEYYVSYVTEDSFRVWKCQSSYRCCCWYKALYRL